jgi:hypothetical protein
MVERIVWIVAQRGEIVQCRVHVRGPHVELLVPVGDLLLCGGGVALRSFELLDAVDHRPLGQLHALGVQRVVDGGDHVAVAGEVLEGDGVLRALATPARAVDQYAQRLMGCGHGGVPAGVRRNCGLVDVAPGCLLQPAGVGEGSRRWSRGVPELDDEWAGSLWIRGAIERAARLVEVKEACSYGIGTGGSRQCKAVRGVGQGGRSEQKNRR